MKKKVLFGLTTLVLTMVALSSCKGGSTPTPTPEKTLTKIEVTPSMKTYAVGYEFTKNDIGSFQAYYSDGSTTSVKEGYTSDPELPYTFKNEDVEKGKDFNFTYKEKSASFHVNVIDTTKKYTVSLSVEPTGAGVISGDGEYEAGKSVTVTATPKKGYTFVGWYEGGSIKSNDTSYTFNMPSNNVSLSARFNQTPVTTYTLKLVSDPTTISPTLTGGGDYEEGTKVTVSTTEVTDYTFLGWYDNDKQISTALSFEYTTGSSAKTLTAKYESSKTVLNNINWNATPIDDTTHGFNNETLYNKAKTATTIIFKQDNSTDGAFAGEETKDKIYAKFDSGTLTIWSNDKIAFEDDDLIKQGEDPYFLYIGPFYQLENVTKIDLANVDTRALTSMLYGFAKCKLLNTIENLSNLNTSNVNNMNGMFCDCNALTSLDLSKFNTSNVENMGMMFYNCHALSSLDLSSFDTSNVTRMEAMFFGADDSVKMKLKSIEFGEKFNTSKVTNMYAMFGCCVGLTSIDVSKFDTSKVDDMSNMFAGCSGLTSLDISNFSFDALTVSSTMFSSCTELKTIYVAKNTDFSINTKITTHYNMFAKCNNLVGGKGTKCDGYYNVDKGYARVDGGTDSPGYFSVKA